MGTTNMAAIDSNGGNRWNILGFNFTKRDALSSLYKISMVCPRERFYRQFKQREKRLLKVVTVILPLYTNNYNTKKTHFLLRRLSNVGKAVPTSELNLFTWNDNIQSFGS
jgi:hypothetical protein